ncbi:MAG: hypothetical protein V3U55_02110, partial [Mycobacterium sp.]
EEMKAESTLSSCTAELTIAACSLAGVTSVVVKSCARRHEQAYGLRESRGQAAYETNSCTFCAPNPSVQLIGTDERYALSGA